MSPPKVPRLKPFAVNFRRRRTTLLAVTRGTHTASVDNFGQVKLASVAALFGGDVSPLKVFYKVNGATFWRGHVPAENILQVIGATFWRGHIPAERCVP